jgi:DUF971 family protein
MSTELRPVALKREGDGLSIQWNDGATTTVSWRVLRKSCPCATCMDERAKPTDPFRVLTAAEVAAGAPAPVAMAPVGYYAYQIRWNDGHDTGIYPLELLRSLGEHAMKDHT